MSSNEDGPVVSVDEHFVHPRLAALYDITSGWGADREYYVSLAGRAAKAVLELGAGTGLVARKLAELGHDVVAADPSQTMLDVGRAQRFGNLVEWTNAPAQVLAFDRKFDFIFMTGHAFQVLLSDHDILATFNAVRAHLAPDGVFAFESRNPAFDWKSAWDDERAFEGRDGTFAVQTLWRDFDGSVLEFEHIYRFEDETICSASKLRFTHAEHLLRLSEAAGLQHSAIYGDWDGSAFSPRAPEIILQVRHK
ncbi:class I SAM-dependent methyltransferase [Roseibium sp.]|uniref:class I SAM-dependent methyltransferase n=1 Tax=Roseibium sp. TaxID=1936156 RepID=UPI003A981949